MAKAQKKQTENEKKTDSSKVQVTMRDGEIAEFKSALDDLTGSGEKLHKKFAYWCGRTLSVVRGIAKKYFEDLNSRDLQEYNRKKISAKTQGELMAIIEENQVAEGEIRGIQERESTFEIQRLDEEWLGLESDGEMSSLVARVISFV